MGDVIHRGREGFLFETVGPLEEFVEIPDLIVVGFRHGNLLLLK
jgi:hypothetical protein